MYRTALLATTALVVGTSLAIAGGVKAPPKGIQVQRPHKNIVDVKRNGIANQGVVLKLQKGAHVHNNAPVVFPSTYSNLSKDANAKFVSWYGFYAENSCYSYYYSVNYHYVSCFNENSAVPVTGAGKTAKKIQVPIYGSGKNYEVGVYSDNAGSPGSLIHGGSASGVGTSYCCSQLQTVPIQKTTLAAGTKYWVEVTAFTGYGLWLTEDTDYSTGQPYDWQYGYSTVGNFGGGTTTYSYHSGWIASTASPYRPALNL